MIDFQELTHKIAPHSKLLRIWGLTGGLSAQVTAMEIEQPDGQTQKLIVRQHGEVDRRHNPHVAFHEFKLLHLLKSKGFAVPTPLHVDQTYLVVEYIDGKTEFDPANVHDTVQQLATYLSRIHRLEGNFSFLRPHVPTFKNRPSQFDESIDEGRIRAALETDVPQPNPSRLLHGDFWPGNVLWHQQQIAAVIDWEDAAIGDPLIDFANSRLEILWAFGIDALETFTQSYQALTPLNYRTLPYWDLAAALRPAFKITEWAGNPITEQRMREQHRWFVAQAFEKLT